MTDHHNWPAPDEHLWGKWMSKSRTEEYRVCLHPDCKTIEYREVASA